MDGNLMNQWSGIAVALCVMNACVAGGPVQAWPSPDTVSELSRAARSSESPDELVCAAGEAGSVTVTRSGLVGTKSAKFSIEVYGGIESLWCGSCRGMLILVWQEGSLVDGSGGALAADPSSGRIIWVARFPDGQVGPPVLRDGALYVSSYGMVGKLGALSGRYVWMREGLARPRMYALFGTPSFLDGKVSYPDLGGGGALVIDDSTGEILSGNPPPVRTMLDEHPPE